MNTNKVAPIGYNNKLPENEKKCLVCSKVFRRKGKRKFTAKFCSVKCKALGQKGVSIKGRPKNGVIKRCLVCNVEFYAPKCYSDRKYCSKKCYTSTIRGRFLGKNHWNWKNGISPVNQKLRKSEKYRTWRTKVFKRDKFTCQNCSQKGKQLEAHHIKSWSEHPTLRFVIKNGITLCKKCHATTDNYKGKNNGKKIYRK